MTVDTESSPVEPDWEDPKQPESSGWKWKVFLGCLVGVFGLLGAYGIISSGVGRSGDTAAASGKTSPAVARSAAATPSAASAGAASPVALAPTPSYQGAFPSPAASPAHALAVTAVAAFGPEGISDGDNPDDAYRAVDDGTQPWYSSWYSSPEFGHLRAGTGLLLDMGKTVTVSSVQLNLGGQSGVAVQVRVGNIAVLGDMFTVSTAADVGGTVRLPTEVRASGRYVLIWFTTLPSIGQGKYQVSVYNATVDGTAGS